MKYEQKAINVDMCFIVNFKSIYNVYFMTVRSSEGNSASILHILTHQSVPTGILEGFLYMWRLIADHVNHKLRPPKFSQFLVCGLHLYGEYKREMYTETYSASSSTPLSLPDRNFNHLKL